MEYGEIYSLKSPSGKEYVGQARCFRKSGRKHGGIRRFRIHAQKAKSGSTDLIHKAIRKYGKHAFTLRILRVCKLEQMDYYETKEIRQRKTLHPNGYNLTSGGPIATSHLASLVIAKRKKNNTGPNNPMYGKPRTEKDKEAIRQAIIGQRRDAAYENLPKHVLHFQNKRAEGYRVIGYPGKANKYWVSKKETMEEKLAKAIEYLHL